MFKFNDKKINNKYSTTTCRSNHCYEFQNTTDDSTIIGRSRTLRKRTTANNAIYDVDSTSQTSCTS
eukprot:5348105-Amphidinium_carterae.3